MEFTTFIWPIIRGSAPTSDLRTISYAVEGEGTKALLKKVRDPYTQDERSSFNVPAIEDIYGFEINYFDGEDWYDEWNAAEIGAMPAAIKVALILEQGTDARKISAIVPIRIR
ncbi:MAG: hypothetical protein HY880_01420 [Deltaproteobacteria bacterium]|nr:hypothetical protein [Deltaproteobacteria bacterium]